MKSILGIFGICLCLTAQAAEQGSARISVTRFRQEADHIYDGCHGWDFAIQDQLQTVLERGLSQNGLKVLEKEKYSRHLQRRI
jgi:hypothetical protein